MARVAILILNYNGADHLKRFLPSMIEHASGYDIIIGDNNSTDNSIDLLKNNFPEVQIIPFKENYGYAGGYNKLIELVDREYLALVNSDVEATQNWLAPLLESLLANPEIAAIQPKICAVYNHNQFEYAGAGGGFIDKYGYPFCRGRIFTTIEEDFGQYDGTTDVFWASGACFMIKRQDFMAVGGFDDEFFAHMEEIDLCWRLQKQGKRIAYTGESKIYHLGGGTLAYNNPHKTYLNFRNSWILLIKNSDSANRATLFLQRYVMDLLGATYFIVQLKLSSALAVFKAHFYILSHLNHLRSKANPAVDSEKNMNVKPADYSIVWQYFLKGKRKFTSI